MTTFEQRQQWQRRSREQITAHQLERLRSQLAAILPANRFYAAKLADVALPLESLDQFSHWPLTTKDELIGEGQSDFAANLTYPPAQYVRYHRTSGTRGRPLVVLDTRSDWQWWMDCWQFVLDAAQLTSNDHVMMAFSFGPFIGFWSAYDACVARGALVVPSGGMTTVARLDLLRSCAATALFCTPSYALHLGEVAEQQGWATRDGGLRRIIVAGEPGGSMPALRQRIEATWNARLLDHSGASEVGPWGFGDAEGRGLHVNEHEFVAEFLRLEDGQPAADGELAELVLTTLGRTGSPVVRYRTGDLVRPRRDHDLENRFVLLDGGVLGRVDDMLIIRGVNIFPTAVEAILREFPEIAEYRLTAERAGAMDELTIEIEDARDDPQRVSETLHLRLGLRVNVCCVPRGTLPRFEAKGRRFVDRRG